MRDIAPWAKDYVGLPFASGGRGRDGLDCYGLIRLVFLEQYKKELPLLSEDYADADNFTETEKVMAAQRPILAGEQVQTPETGDICVVKYFGYPSHVGIYAGGGYILHTLRHSWSVLQRCDDPSLAGRIEGWYRVN